MKPSSLEHLEFYIWTKSTTFYLDIGSLSFKLTHYIIGTFV